MVATRPIEAEDNALEDTGGQTEARWEFDLLFRLHARRLIQVAWLMTGDRNEAEDVVAEVFARVYRKPPPGVGNPIGYLRRAVVNEVIGRARSAARRRSLVVRCDPVLSPDDDVAERDRVWRALCQLSDRQRAALVLRYFEDLSEIDIARTLGVRPGAVKSTTARAVERLRELLGGDEDE